MLIVDDIRFHTIGDPHIGRKFNGTPIHRRGEREEMQFVQLVDELAVDCDVNVTMGDLFDKALDIPESVIARTADIYLTAARARPKTHFIVMAGNHDLSQKVGTVGAFHLFAKAVARVGNIQVLFMPAIILGAIFYPWQWGITALEQTTGHRYGTVKVAFGHWDLEDFGGSTDHMCPARQLAELGVEHIVTGHWHLPGTYQVDGVDVLCTGSMAPYTHAEDPDGDLYVTLTLEEALSRGDLYDKCVRVLLTPGETLPDIDCLQLTSKRVGSVSDEEVELTEVGLGDFNLTNILNEAFDEQKVVEPVRVFIREKLGATD